MSHQDPELVQYPITDILDLHTFSPREITHLIPDYLAACLEKGIFSVRIIHGKGSGQLRAKTHAILSRLTMVESIAEAPGDAGGWGATLVKLKKTEP